MLGSCSESDNNLPEISNEMRFLPTLSTKGTRVSGNAFQANDAIGVYVTQYDGETAPTLQVSGNYASNIKTEYSAEGWQSTPAIYWSDGKFDVYAYYPYATPESVDEYTFSVSTDQSGERTNDALGGYEASDFLWAKTSGVSQTESVPLVFSHKMSRLVVNLIKGDDFTGDIPTDAVLQVHNTVPVAHIDLSTGVVVKHPYESTKSITAHKVSDTQFESIIVPQRMENKVPLVEVITKGVSYLIESKFVFKSGTTHTINLTLSDDPEQVKITLGGEISGWE